MNEVRINVVADGAPAQQALGGIKDGLVAAEAQGKLAADTIANVGASVGAFAAQAIAAGDEILSTSQKMGVSTDALQEMRFWADQGGVSTSALERAVATLNQRVGEAAGGNAKYAKTFEDLGVEVTDAAGGIRSTEAVLGDTVTALREIDDPATRAAAAAELFGSRLGRELLPALDSSQMSMEEAAARARELGIVMDSEAVAASDQFADSLSALQQTGAGILRDFLIPLVTFIGDNVLPVLTDLAAGFHQLPGPVSAVASVVGILSVTMLILAPRVLAARSALVAFGLSAQVANRSLGVIGVVLGIGAAAMLAFGASSNEAAGANAALSDSLDAATGAVTDHTRQVVIAALEENEAARAAERLGVNMGDLADAALGNADAHDRVFAAVRAYKDGLSEAEVRNTNYWDTLQQMVEGLEEVQGELGSSQQAWQRSSEATESATSAIQAHLVSLEEMTSFLKAETDPVLAFARAQRRVADAQREATAAAEEFGAGSAEHETALLDQAAAELELANATADVTGNFREVRPVLEQMVRDGLLSRNAFRALARAARDAERQLEDLDGTRARTYQEHTVTLTTVNQQITQSFGPNAPQAGRAHGGIVGQAAGGGPRSNMVLVGEQGPEIVHLPPGSDVETAGATQAMLAGAGAGVVEVRFISDGNTSDRAGSFIKYVVENALRVDGAFRESVREALR